LSSEGISFLQGAHQVAQKLIITSFPLYWFRLISLPEKSSNISDEIGFGISFITILLSGIFSFVCDIDEKILKQKRKIENFIIFLFLNIKNKNLTHEKKK